MSDEHPTVPLPDPGAQWVLSTDADATPPPRRKARWPWLVALASVIALAIGAWFAAEAVARQIVERTIRQQLVEQLNLPADHPVRLEIPGAIVPQLISGTLDHVEASSEDVAVQGLSGDVAVSLEGVPIRGDGPWRAGSATVTLDEDQVRTLLSRIDGFPAETVRLGDPEISIDTELSLFALSVPIGVDLAARAEGGDIVLTPTQLRAGGVEVSASALLAQFGALASTVIRDWEVCVADQLPGAVTIEDVAVVRRTVVIDLDLDGALLHDPAARAPGACA